MPEVNPSPDFFEEVTDLQVNKETNEPSVCDYKHELEKLIPEQCTCMPAKTLIYNAAKYAFDMAVGVSFVEDSVSQTLKDCPGSESKPVCSGGTKKTICKNPNQDKVINLFQI
jgi:hypothetical protein